MKRSTLFFFSLLLLMGCQEPENTTEQIEKEPTQEQKAFQEIQQSDFNVALENVKEAFEIHPQKAQIITTDKGTRIHIPKDAFEDFNGKMITDAITFEVMEFNTRGEIIASNIPMIYENEKGEKEQFESAGMFSLDASVNGEPVRIAPDKKMKVEYANTVEGSFNFYKLKGDSSNWELKDTECLPQKNSYKASKEKQLSQLKEEQPSKPKKVLSYKKGDQIFDIKHHNTSSYAQELLTGLMWKYIGDDPKVDPYNNRETFNKEYSLVSISEMDTSILAYDLSFKTKEEETVDFPAAPVYQGKLLDRENKKIARNLKKLEESLRSQKEIAEALERESELMRTFEVEELGIYNYDIKWKDSDLVPFIADFEFEGAENEIASVFLLPTDKRIVIKYTPTTYEEFAINPKSKNKIIAILKDNSIYALSNQDLAAMNLGNIRPNSEVTFTMKKQKEKVTSAAELDEGIASL